ncbi:hypothetical protein V6N13_079509 [Hibiscus sabdariffa]|uniref:Uncharacterized protein n=1 Tax=Hibiscus sabdariffa TaxID=183260 RepID=A0ABR2RRM8_9ROSI
MPEEENLSSIHDKKGTHGDGGSSSSELRKQPSTAEEGDDLGWYIEDDDEPKKQCSYLKWKTLLLPVSTLAFLDTICL